MSAASPQGGREIAAQVNRSGAAPATAEVDLRAASQARQMVIGMQAVMNDDAYGRRGENESGEVAMEP